MATGFMARHSEETSPDAYEVSCRIRMGVCTRFSCRQIDEKSSTTKRTSPQGASFDTPKCGSPAPAKRMLRVLIAVTGLGEPHQVLRQR
jgi:hypothetical protein